MQPHEQVLQRLMAELELALEGDRGAPTPFKGQVWRALERARNVQPPECGAESGAERGGAERGAQGFQPWVGDRSGGHAAALVCVVRVFPLKIGKVDRAAVAIFQQGGVNDGGVAIELDTLP